MGWFREAVSAFVGGHHVNIESTLHVFGCRPTLRIDGKAVASELAVTGAPTVFLAANVGGLRVLAEVRQGWTSTRYRLFIDEEQVPLRITNGAMRFVALPRPLQLSSARPT